MRAVLDTNVLVSAALSRRGAPARILEAWFQGAFELVTSLQLLDEFERVLAYPKIRRRISESEAASLVRLVSEGSVTIDDPGDGSTVTSRDPGDDFLIELAFESRSLLVSGDPDLLDLSDRIPVLSPAAFFEKLGST